MTRNVELSDGQELLIGTARCRPYRDKRGKWKLRIVEPNREETEVELVEEAPTGAPT